ncbi:MAG: type II toxin-antitoxin system Phd/YefM family antitoxin [Chloroflexota bacterium]
MSHLTVGIRELKKRLSRYIRQVESGDTVVVTLRGKPVGRIVPLKPSLEARLQGVLQTGLAAWSGRKLAPIEPVTQTQGGRTVADLLLEDRE